MNIQKEILAAILLLIVSFARGQTVEYIHTDALGSPVAVTNASGAVIERTVYEPYGAVINRPVTNGPGYTGHVMDAVTGLNYMQQRYYDPQVGRFLSNDPVTATSVGGNFNRYWYADNNPYKYTDPTGLDSCETVNEDGTPSSTIPNCIGDPDGPPTPIAEAVEILYEVEVTASKIKKDSKTKGAIKGTSGEVGFKRENDKFTSVDLIPKCTQGNVQAFVFPNGFLTGAESSAGHTHNKGQLSGIGPHDAAMALQVGMNIQADSMGTRGIAKLSTGSAIAVSPNGNWGQEGLASTAQAVLDLANATKGGKSNAPSTSSPCN